MGLNGACIKKAVYRLSCPHSEFSSCGTCLPLNYKKAKCGCSDEDISAIISPADLIKAQQQPQNSPTINEGQLKWVDDGVSEIGWIEDGLGNKFVWNERVRADGAVGYRCIHQLPSKKRCTAVARRFFYDKNTRDRERAIILESPHIHQLDADLEKSKEMGGK